MVRWFAGILFLLIASVASAQESSYKINPGDVLEISVWKEEGLEREVLVLPDGKISFPLAGHLKAAGRSPEEVQKALSERIKKYIPDPVITVTVRAVAGNKIYVIGQVQRPGEFQAGQRIDVIQALSQAGGLTPFADEDKIVVLRRENGNQIALPFDYSKVKKGRRLEMNVILISGDVVVVPDCEVFGLTLSPEFGSTLSPEIDVDRRDVDRRDVDRRDVGRRREVFGRRRVVWSACVR